AAGRAQAVLAQRQHGLGPAHGQRPRRALAPQRQRLAAAFVVVADQGDAGGALGQPGIARCAARGLQVPVGGLVHATGLGGEFAGQGRGHGVHLRLPLGPGQRRRGGKAGAQQQRNGEKTQDHGHLERPGRKMSAASPTSISQAPEPGTPDVPPGSPPSKRLFALGINHQTAPVALRERVTFAEDAIVPALAQLRALPRVREVALLSTCNRTELYAVIEGDDGTSLVDWLATHPTGSDNLHAYLYRHQDGDAARHLFRVATGLDSLVLGEPQILGQVKHAWTLARTAGTLGGQLDRLFQHAFVTAKRARTETRIGNSPVSVASVAVRLAQESFAQPSDSTVLLIGA